LTYASAGSGSAIHLAITLAAVLRDELEAARAATEVAVNRAVSDASAETVPLRATAAVWRGEIEIACAGGGRLELIGGRCFPDAIYSVRSNISLATAVFWRGGARDVGRDIGIRA